MSVIKMDFWNIIWWLVLCRNGVKAGIVWTRQQQKSNLWLNDKLLRLSFKCACLLLGAIGGDIGCAIGGDIGCVIAGDIDCAIGDNDGDNDGGKSDFDDLYGVNRSPSSDGEIAGAIDGDIAVDVADKNTDFDCLLK